MRYLLDTNAVSEMVAKAPNPRVVEWIDSLDPQIVFLSVITIGEIKKGIEKLADSPRKNALEQWLRNDLLLRFDNRILSIDIEVMLEWGALVAKLERLGRPLPAMDSLIAALARNGNCILVTRNESDFADVDISIVNPWRQ